MQSHLKATEIRSEIFSNRRGLQEAFIFPSGQSMNALKRADSAWLFQEFIIISRASLNNYWHTLQLRKSSLDKSAMAGITLSKVNC